MLRSAFAMLHSAPVLPRAVSGVGRRVQMIAASRAIHSSAQPTATGGFFGLSPLRFHQGIPQPLASTSKVSSSWGTQHYSFQQSRQSAVGPAGEEGAPAPLDAMEVPNTQAFRLPLFLGYTALGAGLTFFAPFEPAISLALVSTMWLGWVLAISLTEAWVKFKAPMLDRHVAVDVGRHVFPALNSAEAAFAATQLLMTWRFGAAGASPATIPLILGALLAAEIVWLTPALSLRAQHLIASSADPERLSPYQRAALAGIKRTVAANPAPHPKLHSVYGVVELSKVALLGTYIWQLVGSV